MRAALVRVLGMAYLSLGLASVSAAQSTRIHVVLDGANASGADVYVDGQLRGRTDASGNLDVDRALLTDGTSFISARLQVYEVPAFLPGHEDARSPAGWVMRAYVTSVRIDDAGTVNMFQVTDRLTTQELVLRRDNALIGLQLLASAEWDLSEADLTRLMQAFQVASRYLWNATDGQFVFETVKIADQARNWDRSQFRLYVDNTTHPRATRGGYLAQNEIGRLVGSYISLSWRDDDIHGGQGELSGAGGSDPVTFVHEFGHLGFELDDEYLHGTCTLRRNADAGGPFAANGAMSACAMDSQFNSVKFCSDQAPNSHHYGGGGLQYDDCWSEIRGAFSDPQGARWTLKTPVTRGAIVGALTGPSGTAQDALPVEWNTNFVVTNAGWRTELCKPFRQGVTFADGSPAPWATVKLLYTTIDPSRHTWVSQGKTFPSGEIAILGAHEGDTVMTQVVFNELTACPQGVWPQGALGVLAGDQDGDRVLDAFDTCPSVFNPYARASDATLWYSQGTSCSCTTSAECGPGLVCSTAGGAGTCIVPPCRSDADCISGRTCQGGSCALPGGACASNTDCPPGRLCDVGNGTSHTALCVPAGSTGVPGDLCSHDNQCSSGNCSGLQPDQAGGWRPGRCSASAQKGLGEYCFSHAQCVTGNCDAGPGTSNTHLCMPNRNGQTGEICSHDNQCTSLNCGGLAPAAGGGWQPGRCSASATKPLGDYCFGHSQCASGYCDAGLGTSNTLRCMPNRNGQPGQICSHDNQCASLNCSGLSSAGSLGTCAAKSALGVSCLAHSQCASGYCDGGSGTSHTWRCMPFGNGSIGDICSNDNQCASSVCAGLRKDGSGAWVPGACAAKKALRDPCSQHYQCASGFCDIGWNTSQTELCMPNGNGRPNDPCTRHNQCTSQVCVGVTSNGNVWIPGTCQ